MTTRFIILSTARTGSNLLTFLLKAHKNVVMHGEIFNLHALEEAELRNALTDPLSYVSGCFDPGSSPGTKAVGFKQFYNHLKLEYFKDMDQLEEAPESLNQKVTELLRRIAEDRDVAAVLEGFAETWQYLRNDTDIRIIHLKRRNKFETLVSLKTAFITNKWLTYSPQGCARTLLELQPEECRLFFEHTHRYERLYDDMFRAHPLLDVVYEDLVEDRDLVLRKVFEFLSLPPIAVSVELQKQIVYPLNEVVTNYATLKRYFRDTPWSAYFHL